MSRAASFCSAVGEPPAETADWGEWKMPTVQDSWRAATSSALVYSSSIFRGARAAYPIGTPRACPASCGSKRWMTEAAGTRTRLRAAVPAEGPEGSARAASK